MLGIRSDGVTEIIMTQNSKFSLCHDDYKNNIKKFFIFCYRATQKKFTYCAQKICKTNQQKREYTIGSSADSLSGTSQCRNIKELMITNRKKVTIVIELKILIG